MITENPNFQILFVIIWRFIPLLILIPIPWKLSDPQLGTAIRDKTDLLLFPVRTDWADGKKPCAVVHYFPGIQPAPPGSQADRGILLGKRDRPHMAFLYFKRHIFFQRIIPGTFRIDLIISDTCHNLADTTSPVFSLFFSSFTQIPFLYIL